jgi:hypothetical protein
MDKILIMIEVLNWSLDRYKYLKIMQNLRVSGYSVLISDKEEENKFGQMVQCMKDGGKIIKLMERED